MTEEIHSKTTVTPGQSLDSLQSRAGKDDGNTTPVNIPSTLADRIQDRLPSSDFESVDNYVSYVLKQVLDELEGSSDQKRPDAVFSKEDQENVEQRLKDLGYM